jgi:hypothetical protein
MTTRRVEDDTSCSGSDGHLVVSLSHRNTADNKANTARNMVRKSA